MPRKKFEKPTYAFACTNSKREFTGHCKPTNDGDMIPVVIVNREQYDMIVSRLANLDSLARSL